ncbi:MAG: PAS domain S-box protein [bacterium]
MSSTHDSPLVRPLMRYGCALGAVAAGFLLRLVLTAHVGPGLPTYITFYPPVMFVALVAGFWPGLLATATAGLCADYWLLAPQGLGTSTLVDSIGLAFFLGMGLFMSVVAELYRRNKDKAAAYEKDLALSESREELRRQREWLRVTLTSIGDAVLATDTDGMVTFLNPVAAALTGWTQEQALGQPVQSVFRILNEKTREEAEDIVALVLRRRSVVSLANHTALVARDGREIPIEDSAAPIRDPAGTLAGVVLVFHDVTAKRRAQEELRESEERLRIVADFTYDMESWRSPDQRFRYLSPSCERITGYGREEFLRDPQLYSRIIHPDDRERLAAHFREDQSSPDPRELEFRMVRRDGQVRWMAHVCQPVLDPQGQVLGRRASDRDITDRKRAEEALREERDFTAAVLDTAGALVVVLDREGRITRFNRACEAITGYPAEEALGRVSWDFLIPSEELPGVRQVWAALQAGDFPNRHENHWVAKDGSRRLIEWSNTAIAGARGEVEHVIATGVDITERRLHEVRIARLTKLYRVLSRVNEAIVRTRSEEPLHDEVCRIVSEEGGFPLAWVGQVKERQIEPTASYGPAAAYLEEIRVEVDGELGKGPTGSCIRENRPVVNDDFDMNPHTVPWRESALRFGFRASAAFPLHRRGKAVGAFTLYASEPGVFDEEQVGLLEALCSDVSYALDKIEQERLRTEAEEALRRSEERFRVAQELSLDAFTILKPERDDGGRTVDFRWEYVNPQAGRTLRRSPEELVGKRLLEVLPGNQTVSDLFERYVRVVETGEPHDYELSYESEGVRGWFRNMTVRVGDGIAVYFTDITERKRVEQERQSRIANLNSLLAVSLDVLAAESVSELLDRVADAARVITRARNAIAGLGYRAGQRTLESASLSGGDPSSRAGSAFKIEAGADYLNLIGSRLSLRLTEEELRSHIVGRGIPERRGPLPGVLGASLLGRDGKAQGLIMVGAKEDGEFTEEDELILRQLAHLASVGVQHLQAREALANSRDELEIRVRERTAELQLSEKRLRDLSARLLTAQEEERRRMALEVHDGLSSTLSATKYRIERILAEGGNRSDLQEVASQLSRTIEDSRRLQMALRPSVLDDLGILAALSWLARETVKAYPHIRVERQFELEEEDVPESLKTVIFRVSQEAVNNIAKHSTANAVSLCLQNVDSRIELAVQDNGRGFDVEEASGRTKKGLGLLSMRERTELSGGFFHIASAAGKGTTIRAFWPLSGPAADAEA